MPSVWIFVLEASIVMSGHTTFYKNGVGYLLIAALSIALLQLEVLIFNPGDPVTGQSIQKVDLGVRYISDYGSAISHCIHGRVQFQASLSILGASPVQVRGGS